MAADSGNVLVSESERGKLLISDVETGLMSSLRRVIVASP
jgi:hypothetical protein